MCGFVGMIGHHPVATAIEQSLRMIQHRGQDAAGIGTWEDRRVHLVKGLGHITHAVPSTEFHALSGSAGIGHVRYPTAGAVQTAEDAQPFRTRSPGILLAHNGNVTNVPELVAWLRDQGHVVLSSCDAEPILLTFTTALTRKRPAGHTTEDVIDAVREVYARVRGAYSVVAVLEVDGKPTMIAFRDPHAIRPGVYGSDGEGGWIVASESVALDLHGREREGDIAPGTVMLFRTDEQPVTVAVTPREARHCAFERIYFARPDSVMEDGRVNRTRWLLGRKLADEFKAKGHTADIVIGIPDSSRTAAMGMADRLDLPLRDGFVKNRYTDRTFIMPDQRTREAALRLKLNPIREMFEGRSVILVDDSIVRGSTMLRNLQLVRTFGPTAIHLAISSPPVKNPCFYGIDMPTRGELIATQVGDADIETALATYFGVDTVTFLSLDGTRAVLGPNTCDACFSGDYIVPVSEGERASIENERRGNHRPGASA